MSDEDLTIIGQRIGYSDTPAEIFGISRADRRRHLYVQGKTGGGKSTLLLSMIAQDLHRGEGVCLIDPLGTTAETVLSYVPKWRTHEVCYLNVADRSRPVGFNILAGHEGDQLHRATAAGLDAFASVWDLSLASTPQLLDVLGYAIAALVAMPGATLLSLPRFLTDKGFRTRMLTTFVSDPAVRAYWQEFGKRSPREQHELTRSVLNKANELCRQPILRNILGQEHNKLDLAHLIQNRGILIVNLAKHEIGLEHARLLAAFLISQLTLQAAARMQALSRRAGEDPLAALSEFPDFYVYLDEFQDMATHKFDEALSQSRAGRVSFALFNQFQAQLPERVHGAIFGNVGSLICFEVGARDATSLAREFDNSFTPEALTGLRQFEIALKLPKRKGNPPFPFKAYTLPVEGSGYGSARHDNIIASSREQFGRPREKVERSVARALMLETHPAPTRTSRIANQVKAVSAEAQPPKPARRCAHCNEAGYLELRHKESGELVVYRCPHQPKLIAAIEARLTASRLAT
jgi:hypothetical protein